jgi:hypothetical protein
MAGFYGMREIVSSHLAGSEKYTQFRKAPSQVTTAGIWFDMTSSGGNPKPFYYASPPLEATAMSQVSASGMLHGGDVSPKQKIIRRLLVMSSSATGLPMPMRLCDYLLYYPFCDMGETEEQTTVNVETLPRYSDGDGVKIMAVLAAAGAGGQTFRVRYTNQDGVTDRFTSTVIMNTATATGSIISGQNANASAAGPFLPLQNGDTGVRSIEGVQMISGADVGLFHLVLVKPLASIQIREQTAPVEVDYLTMQASAPVVQDGAYLNFICLPNGSLSGVNIHGELTTIWN